MLLYCSENKSYLGNDEENKGSRSVESLTSIGGRDFVQSKVIQSQLDVDGIVNEITKKF